MAQRLVFFFGRDPKLSLAEALFFFKETGIAFSIVEKAEKLAVFEFEKAIDAKATIKLLGGTTKIATVLFELENLSPLGKKLEESGFFFSMPNKIFFHAKALTENGEDDALMRETLSSCFKEQKIKAMFKHPKPFEERAQETMGPSELKRWKLLDEGFELLLLQSGKTFLVCKTVAATDIDGLKKRDLGRPAQKPKHEISLRLARILLNLAGAIKEKTVLDPFCGTGTILQEALLNGANAIGIELAPETAAMAEKNLEWFSRTHKTTGIWRVLNADSTKLSCVLKKREFDCVATEPFMGPLVNPVLPEQIVKKTVFELEQLYSAVFSELQKLMEKRQRVVFILPGIPATNSKVIFAGESVFLKNGFACVNPEGESIFPYIYKQENSKITRKIYVLEKA